jgi:hypothetical protein
MPRKTPLITVSAVVTPVIAEEIARMADANKMTKSQMVRKLLEEKLTEKANERQEDAYDRLEKRLKRIEDRFSGLIVKNIKFAAQGAYIGMRNLEISGKAQSEAALKIYWKDSIEFAGKAVEAKVKKED